MDSWWNKGFKTTEYRKRVIIPAGEVKKSFIVNHLVDQLLV